VSTLIVSAHLIQAQLVEPLAVFAEAVAGIGWACLVDAGQAGEDSAVGGERRDSGGRGRRAVSRPGSISAKRVRSRDCGELRAPHRGGRRFCGS